MEYMLSQNLAQILVQESLPISLIGTTFSTWFFTSGFFWFFEGILACIVLIGLKQWAEDRGIPMRIWKWTLVVGWMLGAGIVIAFIGTALGENEPHAAKLGGVIFGCPVVMGGIVLWRLLHVGRVKTAKHVVDISESEQSDEA